MENNFIEKGNEKKTNGARVISKVFYYPWAKKKNLGAENYLEKTSSPGSLNSKASIDPHKTSKKRKWAISILLLCGIIIASIVLTLSNNKDLVYGTNTSRVDESECSTMPMSLPKRSSDYSSSFRLYSTSPRLLETENNNNCSMRYTLTECDLLDLMYSVDPPSMSKQDYLKNIIRVYLPHLITALEIYDLNCSPTRIISYLVQVKDETSSLIKMKDISEGGAGSFHMLPQNFPLTITQIPTIYDIYTNTEKKEFENVKNLNDFSVFIKTSPPVEDAFLSKVVDLLSRPETTFLSGAWWMKYGSTQIMGDCEDLRPIMDSASKDNLTNIQKVTKCIFGSDNLDRVLATRSLYFSNMLDISKTWECQSNSC
jgi:hypothetical protein